MRFPAIPLLLLLALAGLALTPPSAAAPAAPQCNGIWAVTETVGPVTVFASPPCYEVSVRAMSCPLAGSWKEVRYQAIAVRAYTCDRPVEAEAMAPPCTCPPPPVCREVTTAGPIANVVSVTVTSDCRVIVEVLNRLVACTEPLDGTWVITQGRLTVVAPCRPQFDPCEPPFECYPEATSASSAVLIPPVCVRRDVTAGPVHANVGQCDPQLVDADLCHGDNPSQTVDAGAVVLTAELCLVQQEPAAAPAIFPVCIWREAEAGPAKAGFDQCRQSHETAGCSNGSAQRIHYYRQEGPVYAQVHFCFPHSPPPDIGSASAADTGPCGVQQRCPAPVGLCSGVNDRAEGLPFAVSSGVPSPVDEVRVSDRCQVDVFLGRALIDPVLHCLWGEQYNKLASAGPVTVWLWGCRPADRTAAEAATSGAAAEQPPCTCPPPRPPCYNVNRAIAWGDRVQADDWCNVTVNLEAYCGLQGTNDHTMTVGKVTVNYQTCQQPPVE